MISMIAAMGRNNVIGSNNDMPWHLPADLKFFKETTSGHTVIMGRKTLESMGKPLPNRKNVIITRSKENMVEGVEVIHDINILKQWNEDQPEEEWFVIGGGTVYEQVLPFADRLYITFIDAEFEGDTFFPEFSENEWVLTKKEKGKKDDKNKYDYYFLQYDRKR